MEESRDATVTVAPPGDVKTEVVKAPFAPTSVPPPSGQKVVMSQNELATEKKKKELERLERRRDNARRAKRKSTHPEQNDASSGEEYPESLMGNYIGQVGALSALGIGASDILSMKTWMETLDADERDSLRPFLPSKDKAEQDQIVSEFLSGKISFFGDLRQNAWDYVLSGMTHPRIRRWKQRLILLQKRRYLQAMREYHDSFVRKILVRKRPRVGGLSSDKNEGGYLNRDNLEGWDEARIKRAMDYRRQETERYTVPEKAFIYRNEWGNSVVAPLKRGPALDGGRPREHPLLKNERPSHVTILCLVRDGASRLPKNEGNRQEICDLLLESQYIREGASMAQLNQVVSGALDRLHYEDDACVRYDSETKHWCYLHNERKLTEFKTPSWAASDKRGEPRRKKVEDQPAVGGGKANSDPEKEPKNKPEEAPEDTPKDST
ncbi:hypothetical protein NDN08_004497 [Rhodosorus marinus]|uniref:Nuclear factor related to kappa-B-binding protein second winged helix domain-containing protein n=1 Tax=Rhodosorus marinus TaxID=101924 RepID=A0AAV8ULT4_9RHOD|nr:hypothetical protein NDN08_004497 [Rhodosorus marinus]